MREESWRRDRPQINTNRHRSVYLPICVICVHLWPNQRSHSFNPSTRRSTSLRFFSKTANMKMIVAPVTIPATYHSHVHPRFADAYQIIVMIDSNRNTAPKSSRPRMRKMIPAKTPASENVPSTSGSHGEFATPLMKMSAVDET